MSAERDTPADILARYNVPTTITPRGVRILTARKCVECGRMFDLLNPDDADEWAYGHDCEVEA